MYAYLHSVVFVYEALQRPTIFIPTTNATHQKFTEDINQEFENISH